MKRRKGPTKKLAPANTPEHACPHEYREDEGLQLEIDCATCKGAHDLASRQCLAGVMNALVAASPPEAIVLRRYTDKRYRGEIVQVLISCASELASLNRLLISRSSVSDRRCRTCHASRTNVVTDARQALLENPIAYLRERPSVLREIRERMLAASGRCADAPHCLEEILADIGLRSGDVALGT
jgi:hypothetical protein